MTFKSSNLVYVDIYSTCYKESIWYTEEDKTRVPDKVKVYQQHICQLQYQELKCKEHLNLQKRKIQKNYV